MALTRLGLGAGPVAILLAVGVGTPTTVEGLSATPKAVPAVQVSQVKAESIASGMTLTDTPSEVISTTFPDAGITITDTVIEILKHPILESIASGVTATDGPPVAVATSVVSLIDTVIELDQVYLPQDLTEPETVLENTNLLVRKGVRWRTHGYR